MTNARGAFAVMNAAFEDNYASGFPANAHQMQFKSSSLVQSKNMGEDQLLGLGRNSSDPYYEAERSQGDIQIPIDVRAMGFWLKGLFGNPETTGAGPGPYTHTFKSGAALPSMAIEVGHPELTPPKFRKFIGIKLGGLNFELQGSGPQNGTINAIAQKRLALAAAPADADPSTFDLIRFNKGGGTIEVGGVEVAAIAGGTFNFTNNLEGVEKPNGEISSVDEGIAAANGSITARLTEDATLDTLVDNETPTSFAFKMSIPNTTHSLIFDCPRAFFTTQGSPIEGPGGIQATFDWQAAFDSGDGYTVRATLVNDVDSYA